MVLEKFGSSRCMLDILTSALEVECHKHSVQAMVYSKGETLAQLLINMYFAVGVIIWCPFCCRIGWCLVMDRTAKWQLPEAAVMESQYASDAT